MSTFAFKKGPMSIGEKIVGAISLTLLGLFMAAMLFICVVLVWEAWDNSSPPDVMDIRWNALDNEWDRNMHDPSQRPPDSIANEARLRMLLLEEEK